VLRQPLLLSLLVVVVDEGPVAPVVDLDVAVVVVVEDPAIVVDVTIQVGT
jgi:hypothetical protein